MSVQLGDRAPAFALPCRPGEKVDVGSHFGVDRVVLLFFPLAFSPVCTDEMCHFRDQWSQWSALPGKVFGISVDSPFITEKFRVEKDIPFPILSDFNREVAEQYGVLHADLMGLKGVAKRSAFVIGADGTVAYRWVTDDPKVQVEFDAIKAALEQQAAPA